MNFKFLDKNKGFTPHHFSKKNGEGYIGIPELLVIMAIIVFLTIIALINYPAAKKQLSLQRSASQLVQDIRRVQEMALASEIVGGAIPTGGYGLHLRLVPSLESYYVLFVDQNNNQRYDSGSEKMGNDIDFEKGIKIKELIALSGSQNYLNIIFLPPDPATYFTDQNGGNLGNQISIVISLISDETKTKTIYVNKAGLIYVE